MIQKETKPAFLYSTSGRHFESYEGCIELYGGDRLVSFWHYGKRYIVPNKPGKVFRGKVWLEEDDKDTAIDKLIEFEKERIEYHESVILQHEQMIKGLEGVRKTNAEN